MTNGGWTKYPGNPVLGGDYGTCFDVSMLCEDGLIKMYFSWRDKKCIAYTHSRDGVNWSEPEICISPVESEGGWEDALNRPSVVRRDGVYHMWYTGQHKPGKADGGSRIFHAVSADGVTFERTGALPVLTPELPWEKVAVMCPHVLWDEDEGLYKMWYSGGDQFEPDAIGYATSSDGIAWEKLPANPVFMADPAVEWEKHKVTACQVIKTGGVYRMLYIGFRDELYAQIGVARSPDGVSRWQRSPLNPIISPDAGAWDADACYKPFALFVGGRWMLWYNGRNGSREQIGLATCESSPWSF